MMDRDEWDARFHGLARGALELMPRDPQVDVLVGAEVAWIRVAAPGTTADGLRVVARGDSVIVMGHRVAPRPPPGAHFQQAEILIGPFRRRIRLPWAPHPRRIDMRALDGIVEIMLVRLSSEGGGP